ncbi:MAG TPA: HU family DNA-binding protein [Pirellulales bacterium]|nr:HU family DNA-binding protein [Pirellulales bacterium]
MTKKEIVKTISEEIGLTQLKTKEIVQKTFDAIVETLVEEKRIELRNFGVFEVKKRAARKARNPRTGDKVYVPEKYVVTFKPGKEMEERVRELERQAAEAAAARERAAAGEPEPPAPNAHEQTSEELTVQPVYGGNSDAAR